MNRVKTVKKEEKFQVSVNYLAEYNGVKGAVIGDLEGLVLAWAGSSGFQADLYAAMSLVLADSVESRLPRLGESGIESLVIKTGGVWITIAKAESFCLVVAAERQTDDLLNIRISRAFEMISSHIDENYPLAAPTGQSRPEQRAKRMEEINV